MKVRKVGNLLGKVSSLQTAVLTLLDFASQRKTYLAAFNFKVTNRIQEAIQELLHCSALLQGNPVLDRSQFHWYQVETQVE